MYNLEIFLVLLILKSEANELGNENPVIRLDYNYDSDEIFTVLKDKPLQIFIKNSRTRRFWCNNAYFKHEVNGTEFFVPETEYKTDNVTIINITKVTAEMSTRWTCPILEENHSPTSYQYKGRHYTTKNVHLHLHVKGAKSIILSANNRNLTFVTANLSVKHDGDADYTYEEGEDVDFSCIKGTNRFDDEIRLEYYNAEGVPLFATKSRVQKLERQQTFRSVLKSKNDKNYLDCILSTFSPNREYRYRTTFYMKKRADAVQHAMMLFVNGQKMTTFSNNDPTSDNYLFRYIEGEVLNVTCRKIDDNLKGTLIFSNDTGYFGPAIGNPVKEIILMNVSTAKIYNKTLTCVINNTDVQKPNARLLFLSDVPCKDVCVQGLPRNNVLYQYSKNFNQWTIEYQYSVNDTLDLTCVSKYGLRGPSAWQQSSHQQFYWKFQGQTIKSPEKKLKNFINTFFSTKTFTKTLDTSHDGSKIQCIYYFTNIYSNKSVEIILRLKPELDSEVASDGFSSDVDSKGHVMVLVGSVGVIAAIITMVCLAYWRKRTKRSNLIQNAYDNLSNQNDSPIPDFPNQWGANNDDSHYSKIDEGVMQENYNYATVNDKLHRTPYKRQSYASENHYSEIDENFKPKTDRLQSTIHNTQYNTLERQASASNHFKSHPSFNNIGDLKESTYDILKHDNPPFNKDLNLSNERRMGSQNKSVTFEPTLSSKQDATIEHRRLNEISDSPYMNTDQGIYMKPGVKQKKPNYENHKLPNQKTDDPSDFDYAEPYSDLEISHKNDFYGF